MADVPRIARLMPAEGSAVLTARLGDAHGGIILADNACVSWALDGPAVHLYDFAGERADAPALVAFAARHAHALMAAVLAATRYEGDPWIEALVRCGFDEDWREPDVRDGRVCPLVSLSRIVD